MRMFDKITGEELSPEQVKQAARLSLSPPEPGSRALAAPYPRWHQGLKQWVLVIERPTGWHVTVRKGDGGTHYAALPLLHESQPENTEVQPPCDTAGS